MTKTNNHNQESDKINKSSGDFDFDRISLFFKYSDKSKAFQVIDDSTCKDFDFEELFMYIDRTSSAIGQQYLYAILRTIGYDNSDRFETLIAHLNNNPKSKELLASELEKLNGPGVYFLQRLIFGKIPTKPAWFKLLPILSGLSMLSLVLSFFQPQFLLGFIVITSVNVIIHYWNKTHVMDFANTIPRLLQVHKITRVFLKHQLFNEASSQIKNSEESLRKAVKFSFLFKWESKISDEFNLLFEYFLDFVKGIFLLEPIFLLYILDKLDQKRSDILVLYESIATLDVAHSIIELRKSLPYYCHARITNENSDFLASEIYHPLTINPVSNTVEISKDKSMLITGSNMSGKSTLIRAIGINVILAQTINTTCARTFHLSKMKLYSAIRISDDLVEDTSYYYAEVKRIKFLLDQCDTEDSKMFLLDELFKGTNTIERIASGKAVLENLNRVNNYVIAATHDVELTKLLTESYMNYHFSDQISQGELSFDYVLKPGSISRTNAISILELNNFPKSLTEEAHQLADELSRQKI